jgi:DNA gyrase subunit B
MADFDGAHIAALLLRFFLLYFPFLIEAGMVYKAIPPLYSIKDGKKRKYFTDNSDWTKYIQRAFMNDNELKDSKKNLLSQKDVMKLFITNADYIYFLEKAADTYLIDPNLLELILIHYINNKDKINIEKLRKEITSVYRFVTVEKVKDTVIISGSIQSSVFIPFNDKFVAECTEAIKILKDNSSMHYILNNKKASIYTVMKAFESYTPTGRQRYKGLGEMKDGELGESVLRPDANRTLIRYTLEDAKEAIEFVREYESNSKKILNHVGVIHRSDLLD